MDLSNILNAATKLSGKVYLTGVKYAPHICTGLGIAGFVGTNALTRKAALQEEMTLAIADEEIEAVKQIKEESLKEGAAAYSDQEYNKDLAEAYIHKGIKIAKLYAAPVAVGAVSIAALVMGHNILNDRLQGVLVAYNGLDAAFKAYRKKTAETIGMDKEEELRMGISEATELDENGKAVVKKVPDENAPIEFTTKFGPGLTTYWDGDPGLNWFFLQSKQDYFNEKLKRYGFVFLNEVLEDLGCQRVPHGQQYGWIDDNDGLPQPQIQFGLEAANKRWSYGGRRDPILLDFNVDGYILDQIN